MLGLFLCETFCIDLLLAYHTQNISITIIRALITF